MRYIISSLAGMFFIAFFFASISSAQQIDIIAFGDSITQGYKDDGTSNPPFGITTPQEGSIRNDGYEPELAALFDDNISRTALVYNWGYKGEQTPEGVNRIKEALKRSPAHFILIMEGANDLINGIDEKTTRDNLGFMIDESKNKAVKPIIGTVTPNTSNPPIGPFNPISLNQKIVTLAGNKGIELADQYAALNGNWQNYNSGDGLHLNQDGEEVMAREWFDAILRCGVPPYLSPPTNLIITYP